MLENRFGKLKIKLIFTSLIFVLIFCPSVSISQTENCWDIARDSYSFTNIYERTKYDIYWGGGVEYSNKTTENIMIWDVEIDENIITFRTTKWKIFLFYCDCETEPCKDAFLETLDYDNETESVRVTYKYNEEEKEVGYFNPGTDQLFDYGFEIPVDGLQLTFSIFMWDFIGGLFLPVLSPSFSIETNYTSYESMYTDFEIEFKDTFRFRRKKFEGYSFSYESTAENLGVPKRKFYTKALIQYNSQGVLYNYEERTEYSEDVYGKYETYWISDRIYTIDDIDESLAVSFEWMFGFVGLIFVAIIFRFLHHTK